MASKTENARVNLYINTKGAETSLKELEKDAAALRRELKGLAPNTQEFADKSKTLQQVSSRIEDVQLKLKGTSKAWEFMKNQMTQWGTAALAIFGTQALFSGINNLISRSAKLSDQFADIRKTTGLSAKGVQELNSELSKLNTRTSTNDLREMAIVAGQLGYNGQRDLLKFVSAMDKLNVALGDEFGSAEEITKSLGGLRQVFTDIKTDKTDEDLLKIGNAINQLSAAGAATAPVISDFSNRIGGMGINLGLSTGEVLGISAALQELNVPAERGGTAVVRILQKMTTETKAFAEIAGLSIKEYENLLNTNLYGAFVRVIQKSQEGGKSTTQFAAMMSDAELKAAGAAEVFSKLGRNTGLLAEKVDLAKNSLKDTNSIMNEFAIKNDNFAAKLEKLQKWIAGIFINPQVVKGMESFLGYISDLVAPTESLAEAARKENIELVTTTSTIMTLNVGNKKRSEMIRELQKQYPSFLSNLDAEKVTNEQLQVALQKVNNEMIKKIAIATKMDAVMEQAKETAERQVEATDAEIELQKKLLAVQDENLRSRKLRDELQKSGLSIEQQASVTLLELEEQGLSRMNNKVVNLQKAYEEYADAMRLLNIEKQKSNDLDKDLQNFKKLLGVSDEIEGSSPIVRRPTGSAAADGKPDKQFDEAAKAYNKYLDGLSKLDKEYSDLKIKLIDNEVYQALRKNAERYTTEKMAAEKAYEDDLMLLNKAHEKGIVTEENYTREKAERLKTRDRMLTALEEEYLANTEKIHAESEEKNRQLYEQETEAQLEKIKERNQKVIELENQLQLALQEAKILKAQSGFDGDAELVLQIEKLAMKRDMELANENLLAEEKMLIEQNYLNQVEQLHIQKAEKERQIRRQVAFDTIKIMQDSFNSAFQIEANNREANLQNELGSLQRQRDAQLASVNLTEDEKLRITKEFNDKERALKMKNFESQKQAAVFQALINGALAATNVIATFPGSLANPLIAVPLSAIGIATGFQIGVIESQPVPQFAKGGNTFQYGGPVDQPQIGLIGEAGPEWVAPNWMLESPIYGPNIQALEKARTGRAFAEGGSTDYTQVPIKRNSKDVSFSENSSNDLLSEIIALRKAVESNGQKEVVLSPYKIEKSQKTISQIQLESSL